LLGVRPRPDAKVFFATIAVVAVVLLVDLFVRPVCR
jgi:hypothetical protein